MNKRIVIKNQNGQSVMEYLILSALIGIFCLGSIQTIGRKIKSELGEVNTQLKKINVSQMD